MNQVAILEQPEETRLIVSVRSLCDAAQDVVIMGRDDLSQATDIAKQIKVKLKEIEEERKRLVKPFNDGVAQINARFKGIAEPLKDAESGVTSKMLAFQQEERKREMEAQRKAQEEHEKRMAELRATATEQSPTQAPIDVPVVPASYKPTTYGQTGAVSTIKKVWTYDVLDIVALAAARPDLVMVDSAKINAEIRGKGGEIPGLHIFQKDQLAVR